MHTRNRSRAALATSAALLVVIALLAPASPAAAAKPTFDMGKPVRGHSSTDAAPSPEQANPTTRAAQLPLSDGDFSGELLTDGKSAASTGNATVDGAWDAVGSSGLSIAHASPKAALSREPKSKIAGVDEVTAHVLSKDAAQKMVGAPLAFTVQRTDDSGTAAPLAVKIPTAALNAMFGGDFASRVRWVQLPAGKATSAKQVAAGAVPVSSTVQDGAVVLTPQATAAPMLVTAQLSGASSNGSGDYTATPLNSTAQWDVSTQTGDFSWSFPLRSVPVAAGPQPNLSLTYDSQSVDGETGATNNQPSSVGEGWSLAGGGFIERSYVPCALDDGPTGAIAQSGDLCWKTDNATLSIAGHAGQLILKNAGTGEWRLQSDDGTLIQHASGSPNCGSNGTYDNDCWVVTTTDGTRYFFGSRSASQSAWTVPVLGNDPGEPCNATVFCMQGWRWNLDEVVDTHGNAEVFYYDAQNNIYSRQGTTPTLYVRGGELDHIDYGMNVAHITDSHAASATVSFTYDSYGRCDDSTHALCTAEPVSGYATTPAHPADYPDIPFDQNCVSGACTGLISPTFWTVSTLASVSTTSWSGGTATKVDTWTLAHSFPDPGDGGAHSLWLTRIDHTGYVGGTATEPGTIFAGAAKANRVWTGPFTPLYKFRLTGITTKLGGVVNIQYSSPECQESEAPTILASPWANNHLCFPEKWAPPENQPQLDLFHKYVVTRVQESPVTGTPNDAVHTTSYSYGTPAWRYETSPLVPEKERTWSRFAGFNQVTVSTGDPNAPATQKRTDYTYYQGLNGDRADDSGGTKTVTVSGTTVPDDLWFAGVAYDTKVRNGASGAVVTDSVKVPWASAATAADSFGTARLTGDGALTETGATSTGSFVTTTTTTHDPTYGYPTSVSTVHSDGATPSCTTKDYVPNNTTAWLIGFVKDVRTVSVPCDVTPTAADLVSETQTRYDQQGYGTQPTIGDVTEIDQNADGTHFIATKKQYDGMGRVTSITDALNHVTTTAYVPAAGATEPGSQTKVTVTDTTAPVAWSTSTTYQPAWAAPTQTSDQNAKITDITYDPLGRRTAVWMPGNSKSTNPSDPNIAYAYKLSQTVQSSVSTTTLRAASKTTAYSLYDGLGQLLQVQGPNPSGKTTVTDYGYDAQGNQTLVNNPYWTADVSPSTTLFVPNNVTTIPSTTQTIVDALGRPTADVTISYGSEKFRTTTSYPGADVTDVTPPTGGTPTATITNSLGQRTALYQYQAATISPTAPKVTTSYQYDNRGNMSQMSDQAGNTWTWIYDLLGHQTRATDPDTGTTTTTYDSLGNILTTTDGRGTVLAYTYDTKNRKTATYSGSTSGAIQAKWTYDSVAGAKGQISTATTYTGSTAGTPGLAYTTTYTGYDSAYQPTAQSVSIPTGAPGFAGTSYAFTMTYNRDETLATRLVPAMGGLAAENLRYGQDNLGNPSNLSGTAVYGALTTNNIGQLVGIDSGVSIELVTSLGYDDATRDLTTKTEGLINNGVSSTPAKLTYARNAAGDVTSLRNDGTGAADTQCFQYDTLRNLTQAWTPSNNTCAATGPTAATALGGPAPYWNSYSVDNVTGNRTQTISHPITSGGATSTSNYTYPAAATARPHAVSTVVTTGTGAGTSTYGYDNAGNTTARPGQTLTWNALGQLATTVASSKTQTNVYTPDGELLLQTDPTNGSTLFLGETQLHTAAGSTTASAVRTYTVGGQTIAERITKAGVTGSIVYFTATDANNTVYMEVVASTSAANAGAVTKRYFDPFGKTRGPAASWTSGNSYLNAPSDAFNGLTQLGVRAYDPALGRFTSVDSVLATSNPQQNNGYSYSGNSPITASDPDGKCYDVTHDALTTSTNCVGSTGSAAGPGAATAANGGAVAGETQNGSNGTTSADYVSPPSPDHPAPVPNAPWMGKPGYAYDYNHIIGSTSRYGSAEEAMSAFLANPGRIFPFPIQGCDTLVDGELCTLHATYGAGFNGDGIVKVETTSTSMKFTVVSGQYFDSPGSTIEFRTSERNGTLYFDQIANAKHSTDQSRFAVDKGLVWGLWNVQTGNLESLIDKIKPPQGPYNAPFTPPTDPPLL